MIASVDFYVLQIHPMEAREELRQVGDDGSVALRIIVELEQRHGEELQIPWHCEHACGERCKQLMRIYTQRQYGRCNRRDPGRTSERIGVASGGVQRSGRMTKNIFRHSFGFVMCGGIYGYCETDYVSASAFVTDQGVHRLVSLPAAVTVVRIIRTWCVSKFGRHHMLTSSPTCTASLSHRTGQQRRQTSHSGTGPPGGASLVVSFRFKPSDSLSPGRRRPPGLGCEWGINRDAEDCTT